MNSQSYNNNNSNSNSNSNHIFVNLPLLLIATIVRELDSDVERICFSLTCRRWFYLREKYIWFTCSYIPKSFKGWLLDPKTNPTFTLNSFRELLHRGVDAKPIKSILVCNKDYFKNIKSISTTTYYDDYIPIEDIENYVISESCTDITFISHIINQIAIDKISKSNIKTVVFRTDSFEFGNHQRLPLNISTIILHRSIDESLLPLNLKKLVLGCSPPPRAIDAAKLPRSLEHLYIEGRHDDPVDVGAFPPNLKFLHYINYYESPLNVQLPQSLTHVSITNIWLPHISNLKSIKRLEIDLVDDFPILSVDIPSSVTQLIYATTNIEFFVTPFIIPRNIKYLRLAGQCRYEPNIFAQFDRLKTLEVISNEKTELVIGELPESLTTLTLPYQIDMPLEQYVKLPPRLENLYIHGYKGVISYMPTTVKTIELRQNTFKYPVIIPPSVETVYFQYWNENDTVDIRSDDWPPSLTSMSTNDILPFQLPKSITSVNLFKIESSFNFFIQRLNETTFLVHGARNSNLVFFISNWDTIRILLPKLNV
ncbi:hypothetical protein PPL_11224 [Heterostelium album PN500]|uniref:F-box domain-containing protein n=1 Tax=Heterostelium pallidum (strain ATCC 26659 / Pp 5 / PN500) TaxID=670386 RepID=D3BTW4_HETP5|nr:hypothetical protein PPL_11224 [Heterostelium album PN500]EFA75150.1 hypothetical protein PPL_11224 [Heterostelium album PN500]|eukprot:XP_020427284.1 hypothetical protein PPL_11224 [Heterostelium album PN500]